MTLGEREAWTKGHVPRSCRRFVTAMTPELMAQAISYIAQASDESDVASQIRIYCDRLSAMR